MCDSHTHTSQADMEKHHFYTNMVEAKKNYPEKFGKYNKFSLGQNSVKGPKDQNNAKIAPKK